MKIEISEQLRQDIYDMCDDELNYKIYSSGCAEDYDATIRTMCTLLEILGFKDDAETYLNDYENGEENEDE